MLVLLRAFARIQIKTSFPGAEGNFSTSKPVPGLFPGASSQASFKAYFSILVPASVPGLCPTQSLCRDWPTAPATQLQKSSISPFLPLLHPQPLPFYWILSISRNTGCVCLENKTKPSLNFTFLQPPYISLHLLLITKRYADCSQAVVIVLSHWESNPRTHTCKVSALLLGTSSQSLVLFLDFGPYLYCSKVQGWGGRLWGIKTGQQCESKHITHYPLYYRSSPFHFLLSFTFGKSGVFSLATELTKVFNAVHSDQYHHHFILENVLHLDSHSPWNLTLPHWLSTSSLPCCLLQPPQTQHWNTQLLETSFLQSHLLPDSQGFKIHDPRLRRQKDRLRCLPTTWLSRVQSLAPEW